MGVNNAHVIMYGVIFEDQPTIKKIGDNYEALQEFMFSPREWNGDLKLQILYDGMNGEYVIIGWVRDVDPDEPIRLSTDIFKNDLWRVFSKHAKVIEEICGIELTIRWPEWIYINHYY